MNRRLISLLLASLGASSLFAGPLQEARINQVVNDVKIIEPQRGAHVARLQEVVKDDLGVHTGIQSRAELLFQDNTLTRLGAETFFSFKPGTRDINLERGTLLLQVPKNLGGAKIRAASVTASITGTTIMMEHLPAKSLKIVVLEGSLRVGLDGRVGETLLLTPGKMVIMNPAAKSIPEPVNVDLRKLMKTSALIDPKTFAGKSKARIAELPSAGLIEKEVGQQQRLFQQKGLVATNLVILGNGTEVVAASDDSLARLDDGSTEPVKQPKVTATETKRTAVVDVAQTAPGATATKPITPTTPIADATAQPVPAAVESASAATKLRDLLIAIADAIAKATKTTAANPTTEPPPATPKPPVGEPEKPVTYTSVAMLMDPTLPVVDPTGATVINSKNLVKKSALLQAGVDAVSVTAPTAGARLDLRGSDIKITDNEIDGINVNGGSALLAPGLPGGDGGAVILGTPAAPLDKKVEIRSTITATSGLNASTVTTGGAGGSVQVVADDDVRVKGATVSVSSAELGRASASGGSIGIRAGGGIRIEDSSQLLSLLDAAAPGPGGTIKFIATRGDVSIADSRVHADRGTVEIGALGGASTITLSRATIAGDVVKIGAIGANGQLIIGGGTISADTTLKLYAGSTNGSVRFTDNTTLGGAGAKTIAGRTVTIDNSKTVTIGGSTPANVFTDRGNYSGSGGNGSTTGHFGGAGAITKPFAQTPAF